MNFCDGSGYGVLVVNRIGCDGPTFEVEAMVNCNPILCKPIRSWKFWRISVLMKSSEYLDRPIGLTYVPNTPLALHWLLSSIQRADRKFVAVIGLPLSRVGGKSHDEPLRISLHSGRQWPTLSPCPISMLIHGCIK